MAKYVIEKYNIKYRNLFLLVFLGSKLIILANHKSNVTLKVYALFQSKFYINILRRKFTFYTIVF